MEQSASDGLRNLGVVWLYVVVLAFAVEVIKTFEIAGTALLVSSLVSAIALALVVLLLYDRFVLESG